MLCINTMANIKTDMRAKLRASKKNKVIHLRVPESIYQAVEELAEFNNCTTSEIARAVLIEKLMDFKPINYENME